MSAIPYSLTHKYIPRIEDRQNNLFIEEYYSSTDTKIFIDDLEQTEISHIMYSIQEQLKPLYGYASNTFDDVAIGNRIVTGILKIPIKNIESNDEFNVVKAVMSNDIENFNLSEEEKLKITEWINPTKNNENNEQTDISISDDVIFDLMRLNYDVNINSDPEQLISELKRFQSKNNIVDGYGTLTSYTREKIHELAKISGLNEITVNPNTYVYSGPSDSQHHIGRTTKIIKGVVIYNINDGWVGVKFEDGHIGYIKQ